MQLIFLEEKMELDNLSNEAYKTLRTNVLFYGAEVKLICFTSCLPSEGKSSVSFNLASSLSKIGKKVAFVDADLRRSNIYNRYIPDTAVYGLSHFLTGQKLLDEVLYETNVLNLDIIFAGPVPPNPSELLSSDYFNDLLSSLREEYDYVIVDTPPIGSVIDGVIVSKNCDGTILVVEANSTSHKLVQQARRQLDQVSSRIMGVVINKVSKKNCQYGSYYKKYKRHDHKYIPEQNAL